MSFININKQQGQFARQNNYEETVTRNDGKNEVVKTRVYKNGEKCIFSSIRNDDGTKKQNTKYYNDNEILTELTNIEFDKKGNKTSIEYYRDKDADGIADYILKEKHAYNENGQLISRTTQTSANNDEITTSSEFYSYNENGEISEISIDKDGDGKIDTVENIIMHSTKSPKKEDSSIF